MRCTFVRTRPMTAVLGFKVDKKLHLEDEGSDKEPQWIDI